MERRPKGYTGIRHETIGSDILAILKILRLPEQVLGVEEARKLEAVDPNGWYPIAWLLDLMENLEKNAGPYALVQMGRTVFKLSHEARVLEVAKSARDIVYGIDDMYHHANRGTGIGGWKVLRFEPGQAELEKTTPHHCAMDQGLLTGALMAVRCPSNVEQIACFRKGADTCVYRVTSAITDVRWLGEPGTA
jgi:hypothetical protein